jgi:hypothetical protein
MDFPESDHSIFHGNLEAISTDGTKAMQSVNLDLLRTGPYHLDGRPKDPHDRHRAELRALASAARRTRWAARLARFACRLSRVIPVPPRKTGDVG